MGTNIVERTDHDLKEWLTGDGKAYADAIGGLVVWNVSDILDKFKPGSEIVMTYRRGAKTFSRPVKLANRYDLLKIKLNPVGKPLPDLVGQDIDGREIRLRDFAGKVVLLDDWATWCGPCIEELPLLQRNWERNKHRGFVWIAAGVDEENRVWPDFARNNRLGGIQLRAPDWGQAMDISSYPTVLMADHGGQVRCRLRGESIAPAVEALLSSKH